MYSMAKSRTNQNNSLDDELAKSMAEALEQQFTIRDEDSKKHENPSAADIAQTENNENVPAEFEESDEETSKEAKSPHADDYVDEEYLRDQELTLNDEDKERRYKEALELKKRGNEEFKAQKYLESVYTYTEAIKLCPLKYASDRSIFYANRAASKASLARKETAIEDCAKAIELNDTYLRAYLRRARLYEESDKLDESLADYKKILEIDKGNKDALQAQYRLPPLIAERNEKLKTEMIGKLKDLGNMILKPFGLSTDNFQMNQDPNSGGYSMNFTQGKK